MISRGPVLSQGQLVASIAWMIGLHLLYGTLMLAWSTIRLRPYESEARPWGLRIRAVANARPRHLLKRRPCGDEPMMWKECTGSLSVGSPIRGLIFLLLTLAAVGGLGYLISELGIPAFHEMREYGYGRRGHLDRA